MEEDASLQAQIFHNTVRENIIFLLLFFLLYGSSYVIIRRFRRRDRDDYFTSDEDEATVFKISLWMCTFSLAVSVGAALLLPISIVSNEVLLLYPNSYYVQWLNSSLIQGLWNHVFLFSNLSLFILLPFAYLFTESEGFTGYRKGLMARVYETFIVLSLMAVLVLGMTSIMSALIDKDKSSIITLLNFWTYYLPFLYSCMSFIGVVMLSICTPLGFVRLFDVVGQFLVKPQFLRDLDEEYFVARMEEESLERRIIAAQRSGVSYQQPPPMHTEGFAALHNGALQTSLSQRLANARITRKTLDNQRQTSVLRRNLLYPVAMLLLFALTVITVLMVLQNTLLLLIGIKALPLSSKQFTLGISSLSKLGRLGAALEVIIIFYLVITSSIGLYTLPLLSRVRPRMRRTPFTHVIVNCILVLILSSALPLLSRILGITDFDLLGDFGRIEWLGNFKIVLLYNLVFAGAATLCLINKFTATVRRELYARFRYCLYSLIGHSKAKQLAWKMLRLDATSLCDHRDA